MVKKKSAQTKKKKPVLEKTKKRTVKAKPKKPVSKIVRLADITDKNLNENLSADSEVVIKPKTKGVQEKDVRQKPVVKDKPKPQIKTSVEKILSVAGSGTETFEISPIKLKEPKPVIAELSGVGLDMGTVNLVAMRKEDDEFVTQKGRNAFLVVREDKATKELIDKLNMNFTEFQGNLCVFGDSAFEMANYFDRTTQRPMRKGVLNSHERASIPLLDIIVKNVLWPSRKPNEVCCFSVPAEPIDSAFDIVYHRNVLETMVTVFGYDPVPTNEGFAVVLAELGDKDYTGIGVSCGGGMVNVCATFKSIILSSFSIAKGGDWIDLKASQVLGISTSKAAMIKEDGMSISRPKTREEEAIAIYYKQLIHYSLEQMEKIFNNEETAPQFTEPVDIVFAGGTSMIDGFLNAVSRELKNISLGIPIGNVRVSQDPYTVARGCLYNAKNVIK